MNTDDGTLRFLAHPFVGVFEPPYNTLKCGAVTDSAECSNRGLAGKGVRGVQVRLGEPDLGPVQWRRGGFLGSGSQLSRHSLSQILDSDLWFDLDLRPLEKRWQRLRRAGVEADRQHQAVCLVV